jgi:hypothetical protein
VVADLVGTATDLTTRCDGGVYGDLGYELDLGATADVHLYAAALDTYGTPIISLRDATCSAASSEIGCRESSDVDLFRRALPAGKYYVDVGSSGPSAVDVVVETSAPTTAPADESCVGSPSLLPDTTVDVSLANHVDDIGVGCTPGYPDAAYDLHLDAASDVLLMESLTENDQGGITFADATCSAALVACATADSGLARSSKRAVPAGDYRVVVESSAGEPVGVTALLRAASPEVLVPFSDQCATATEIPPSGGYFEGNTANATNDYSASCDFSTGKGAPDQMLHLHLDAPKRVVLDGQGSSYSAIIDVRSGPGCPGTEVVDGCSAGYVRDRGYLDLSLDAGDYWVQIDGYQGSSGAWVLDVFVVDP